MKWILAFILSTTFAYSQVPESLSPPSKVSAGADSFTCGVYLVAGEFAKSPEGEFVLMLYPGTSRSFPITLNKMNHRDAIILNGAMIRAKLKVTHPGVGNQAKFYVLEKPSHTTRTDALHSPLTQITNTPCK